MSLIGKIFAGFKKTIEPPDTFLYHRLSGFGTQTFGFMKLLNSANATGLGSRERQCKNNYFLTTTLYLDNVHAVNKNRASKIRDFDWSTFALIDFNYVFIQPDRR